MCLILFTFLGLVLDIIALRYREKARWIIYFEIIYMIIQSFVPYNFGSVARSLQFFTIFLVYVGYSVDLKINSIFIIVLFFTLRVFNYPFMYNLERTPAYISTCVWECLILFFMCTNFSMNFTYLANLKVKISNLLEENLKLLNSMHEGLIVISKDDRTLKFANKSAVHYLKKDISKNTDEEAKL